MYIIWRWWRYQNSRTVQKNLTRTSEAEFLQHEQRRGWWGEQGNAWCGKIVKKAVSFLRERLLLYLDYIWLTVHVLVNIFPLTIKTFLVINSKTKIKTASGNLRFCVFGKWKFHRSINCFPNETELETLIFPKKKTNDQRPIKFSNHRPRIMKRKLVFTLKWYFIFKDRP